MEFTSYKCDVCARTKGEANHWYMVARMPGPKWIILAWGLPLRDEALPWQHVCGLECATKAMHRAMNEPEEVSDCAIAQQADTIPREV